MELEEAPICPHCMREEKTYYNFWDMFEAIDRLRFTTFGGKRNYAP